MAGWPWTFATLPAGNVAASKLDDNFNAAMFSAGSSTDGAVPTWNGAGGTQLNTGGLVVGTAANNLVQLDGSGKLPVTVLGAVTPVLLTTLTASNSATLAYTSLSATYNTYQFVFINIIPQNSGVTLRAQVSEDGGSTYKATGYVNNILLGTTSAIEVAQNSQLNNGASYAALNATGVLYQPSSTGVYKTFSATGSYVFTDNTMGFINSAAQYRGDTNAINGIQFFCSSGNIVSGIIEVWGYA